MDTRNSREIVTVKQARSIVAVLGGGIVLVIILQGLVSTIVPFKVETKDVTAEEIRSTKTTNPFENISLVARAVYVLDLKTNVVLFARNENEKLPLASVTKLMTAYLSREHMPESAVVTLTKGDLATEGDSGLHPGERWRLGDILNVMLLVSSNDAAHAVAGFVGADGLPSQTGTLEESPAIFASREHFVKMMNEKALDMGLDKMEFFNESGLDINELQSGGYGSAKNVAELFSALWNKYPETIEISARKSARIVSQDNITHTLSNTNEIVGHLPGLVASKTGYTNISGGNLAIIFDKGIGEPVIIVVLGSGYKERFDDMRKLVSRVFDLENSQN